MKALTKIVAASALALAMTAATFDTAEARSRRGAGIALGIAAGALIAGAAISSARASDRGVAYYSYRSSNGGCHHLKTKAVWHEEEGRHHRARYYWNQYNECRGY